MVRPATFTERYFWPLLGVLFLALFGPLLVRDWLALKTEGLYDVEWHTTSLTKLLHRDLEHHRPLEQILHHLDDPQLRKELADHLDQKIGHLGLLLVKIFDSKGTLLYSTAPNRSEPKIHAGEGFRRALRGEIVSKMITPEDYAAEYGVAGSETMAEVHVPLGDKGKRIEHVLEAYYDCGPMFARTTRLFQQRALTLASVLLLVISLLGWVLRSRQRMADKVELLESILPICMHCKKIRIQQGDDTESWVAIENYLRRKNAVDFSHGICDDCLKEHYPEVSRARKNQES